MARKNEVKTLIELFADESVNAPPHYKQHPSGIECIEVTEHMPFCTGNAVKYLWRAGLKGDAFTDLKKAVWYIEREIKRIDTQGDMTVVKLPETIDPKKIAEGFSEIIGHALIKLCASTELSSNKEGLLWAAKKYIELEIELLENEKAARIIMGDSER